MKKVIIIGAGVAGMTAAMYAIKAGYSVDLYTSSKYIGGRCSTSFVTISYKIISKKISNSQLSPDFFYIDNGQHLISGAYSSFFELLDWLGTRQLISDKKGIKVDFIDIELNRKYNIDFTGIKNKLDILLGLLKIKYISVIDKIRLINAIQYLLKNKNELTNYTILEICKKLKISDYTITHLINPIVLSIMNSTIDIAPISVFISTLEKLMLAGEKGFILTHNTKPFDKLFAPFIDKINSAKNCNLYTQSKVEDFIIKDGICQGIILADKKEIKADVVISALNCSNYKFMEIYNDMEQNFPYSAILSVCFWTNEKLNLNQEYNVIIGSRIDWIFDMNTEKNDAENLYKYQTTSSNFMRAEDEDIKILIQTELKKIFKKEIFIYGMQIINQKHATVLLTNKNYKLRPVTKSHIKNLYIAGDWTNTGLPCCIESAAISGYNAVKAISS